MGLKAGVRNLITDVPGLTVGQAEDPGLKSGVSVVVGDAPMVAGVHVMGGAPGTRETDLLSPDTLVERVDALTLSGGSAFGLSAGQGVALALAEDGRGYETHGGPVPIVPGAILFDLANGGEKDLSDDPYCELGRRAYAKRSMDVQLGSHGAGTGALVAGLKGGVGSASLMLTSGATVGALIAVNAVGQVTVGDGPQFWAAPWEVDGEFGGLGVSDVPAPEPRLKKYGDFNTVIGIVATDVGLTQAQSTRLAKVSHDGIARAIVPSHLPTDGDLLFACSTGDKELPMEEFMLLGHWAATCVSRAIARAVYEAHAEDGDTFPTWREQFG